MQYSAAIREISDGTSTTIAMGEIHPACADHHWGGWWNGNMNFAATTGPLNFKITCQGDQGFATQPAGCNRWDSWSTSMAFKSRHPGGALFVFADGHVQFISETIDYRNYQRLGSRRGGEPLSEF